MNPRALYPGMAVQSRSKAYVKTPDAGYPPLMNRVRLTLTLAMLCVTSGGRSEMNSRSTFSPGTQRDVMALRAAAQSSDYSYEQVGFLCNSIGPRLSGSQQAAAAVDYVKRQMMDLGFEVKLEPVTVRHWVHGQEEAQLTRYLGQVPGTFLNWSQGVPDRGGAASAIRSACRDDTAAATQASARVNEWTPTW